MITQEYLRANFYYEDGMLYRKHNTANNKIKSGDPAARLHKATGYYRICIDNKRYPFHRVMYLYHHGVMPDIVDHIDCDKTNNRIENLRDANATWNNTNKKIQRNNSSGIKGISFYTKFNRIHAQIQVHGKKIHKTFVPITEENLTLAKRWLDEQRNKLHGDYANHG
jgi:HNH endonuclease